MAPLTAGAWAVLTAVLAFAPRPALAGLVQRAATGRIEGHVTITLPARTAAPSAAYAARRVEKAPPRGVSELSNVVVFIADAPHGAAAPVSRARMVQEDEAFVPRVLAITRGSTVDFPNGDPFFHDVFSLSRNGTFDLGSYPRGQIRSRQFQHAGLVKVDRHIHSQMSASIMIFDHPFFTIPRADGTFTIDDVPAGTYKVSAWHERVGETTQAATVEPGRTAALQFILPIPNK